MGPVYRNGFVLGLLFFVVVFVLFGFGFGFFNRYTRTQQFFNRILVLFV